MKLSANGLKWIAMITMFADHTGLVLIEYLLYSKGEAMGVCHIFNMPWEAVLFYLGHGMRMVGRIAFPLYCFLLTEGFLHTRNWKKYWMRLGVFALVSQLPFSLAVFNVWFGPGLNVYFELAVGILMLQGFGMAEKVYDVRRGVYLMLVLIAACVASELGAMDYGAEGMLVIAAFYLLRDYKVKRVLSGGLISMVDSLDGLYGAGVLSVIPMALYSGEKGKQWNKYFFYFFYPAHLLILFLIRRFLLGVPFHVSYF